MKPGDSLKESVDKGLTSARYGVVVLSKAFFKRGWTEWELSGLLQRDLASEKRFIIPIWHGVSSQEVRAFSPPLADRLAIKSDVGVVKVAKQIYDLIDLSTAAGSTKPVGGIFYLFDSSVPDSLSQDLSKALDAAVKILGVEGEVRVRAFRTEEDRLVLINPETSKELTSFKINSTVAGASIQTGKRIVVMDTNAIIDSIFTFFSKGAPKRIRSFLVVPLKDSSGQAVAVLNIDSDKENAFDQRALDLSASVAYLLTPFVLAAIHRRR
jgi:putative methionine-R-sulfoxide reductase with GAF domain